MKRFKIRNEKILPYLIDQLKEEGVNYQCLSNEILVDCTGNKYHYCLTAAYAALKTEENGLLFVTQAQLMKPGILDGLFHKYNCHGYVIMHNVK